jgi:hypothetical protein
VLHNEAPILLYEQTKKQAWAAPVIGPLELT